MAGVIPLILLETLVDLDHSDIHVSRLQTKAGYRLDPWNCFVIGEDGSDDKLMSLISNLNAHQLQRRVLSKGANSLNNDVQHCYKVKVAPLIIFTDGTSKTV